jgi:hypothetical protein
LQAPAVPKNEVINVADLKDPALIKNLISQQSKTQAKAKNQQAKNTPKQTPDKTMQKKESPVD